MPSFKSRHRFNRQRKPLCKSLMMPSCRVRTSCFFETLAHSLLKLSFLRPSLINILLRALAHHRSRPSISNSCFAKGCNEWPMPVYAVVRLVSTFASTRKDPGVFFLSIGHRQTRHVEPWHLRRAGSSGDEPATTLQKRPYIVARKVFGLRASCTFFLQLSLLLTEQH